MAERRPRVDGMYMTETIRLQMQLLLNDHTLRLEDGNRDVWYRIKDQVQKHQKDDESEEKFQSYGNKVIGDQLWELFTNGYPNIYNQIGCKLKQSDVGESPVVLFCEKQLKVFQSIEYELSATTYLASGQSTSFEIALLAQHHQHQQKLYLFTLTDYDPSGVVIASTVAEKFALAFEAIGATTEVIHIPIKLNDPIENYTTYELSPASLQTAEKVGFTDAVGVELNVVPPSDRYAAIIDALEEFLPKDVFSSLSKSRARSYAYEQLMKSDPLYLKLKEQMEQLEENFHHQVQEMKVVFDPSASTYGEDNCIRKMTTLI